MHSLPYTQQNVYSWQTDTSKYTSPIFIPYSPLNAHFQLECPVNSPADVIVAEQYCRWVHTHTPAVNFPRVLKTVISSL